MASGAAIGVGPSPINERVWIGDYLAEMQREIDSLIRSRLRGDLYSIFGEDVRQEACCRLMLIFRRPRYAGINETNWREPGPRAILDRCMFATVNLTRLEMIRRSKKFDRGMEGMEQFPEEVNSLADVGEARAAVVTALQELSERDRNFWQLAAVEGLSYKEIAQRWGVSEGFVRLIRFRLVASLKARLR